MKFLKDKIEKSGLKSQKVFVVPTKAGYFFFLCLLIIFFMGLVYGNNMCFLIAFLMLGQFIATLLISHRNIQKIVLSDIHLKSNHVDKNIMAEITLKTPEKTAHQVKLNMGGRSLFFEDFYHNECSSLTSFSVRGKVHFNNFYIHSTYPFGLFTTWRYFNIKGLFHLYPKLIEGNQIKEHDLAKSPYGFTEIDADFQEHKRFEKGHSMKRIDWKKFAMTDELFFKRFTLMEEEKLKIDFEKINYELEEKLQIVTTLIFNANQDLTQWELSFFDRTFTGSEDYKDALEYLSTYGIQDQS